MDDCGWVFRLMVDPTNAACLEDVVDDIFTAMGEEEFGHGGVRAYAVCEVTGEPGSYLMYEYFTPSATEQHAQGPQMQKAGAALMSLMTQPFDRSPLTPLHSVGIGHVSNRSRVASEAAALLSIQVHPKDGPAAEELLADLVRSTPAATAIVTHRHPVMRGRYVTYVHDPAERGSGADHPVVHEIDDAFGDLKMCPSACVSLTPRWVFGIEPST